MPGTMASNAIDDIAADTPLPTDAASGAAPSPEDQMVDRFMARLAQRGLTLQPSPQQQQEPGQQDPQDQPEQPDQEDQGSTWNQSWDHWNGQAWSWANWSPASWSKDDKYDRPYIPTWGFRNSTARERNFTITNMP